MISVLIMVGLMNIQHTHTIIHAPSNDQQSQNLHPKTQESFIVIRFELSIMYMKIIHYLENCVINNQYHQLQAQQVCVQKQRNYNK